MFVPVRHYKAQYSNITKLGQIGMLICGFFATNFAQKLQ